LETVQAKTYLLVTCGGRMSSDMISERLDITVSEAQDAASSLVDLGAFINMTDTEFEAMHPRFTAVNMYRRICERRQIAFGRNRIVDAMGAALEQPYDDARTK